MEAQQYPFQEEQVLTPILGHLQEETQLRHRACVLEHIHAPSQMLTVAL